MIFKFRVVAASELLIVNGFEEFGPCVDYMADVTSRRYTLVADISAHESDVKATAFYNHNGQELIATSSRDGLVKVWAVSADLTYKVISKHAEHNGYVNAVTFLKDDEQRLLVASGDVHGVIYLYDYMSDKIKGILLGHSGNVCYLYSSHDNCLVSCSWDKTCKVWEGLHCIRTLSGHEEAVWTACSLDGDQILTGSADTRICCWADGRCIRTYSGHKDVVRSILPLSGSFLALGDFASVGNDGYINFWNHGGQCTHSIKAHDSFIYSLKCNKEYLFSAGEDRVVKVWCPEKNGVNCIQAIPLPAMSIWSIELTDEGDLICGCSDGHMYMLSLRDNCPKIDPSVLAAFEQRLKTFQISRASTLDAENLTNKEFLQKPGEKVGQVKLLKSEAFQWDGTKWEKIGDVVENPSAGEKKVLYNGEEYDFVFDVDIGDDGTILKLPYNQEDNPYTAAAKFLAEHDLSPNMLDQVANFIVDNTSTKSIERKPELYNPYAIPEGPKNHNNPNLYSEYNLAGIMKKLESFNALEDLKISEKAIDTLNSLKFECKEQATEIVSTSLDVALAWKIEHLFPVFDILRVLLLNIQDSLSENFINRLFQGISRIKLGDAFSILTASRLAYNLLHMVSIELLLSRKYIDQIMELAYIGAESSIKDKLLPAKLCYRLSVLINRNKPLLQQTNTESFMLFFVRIRQSSEAEERGYILNSIKNLASLLSDQQKQVIISEVEAASEGTKAWDPKSIDLRQQTISLLQI